MDMYGECPSLIIGGSIGGGIGAITGGTIGIGIGFIDEIATNGLVFPYVCELAMYRCGKIGFYAGAVAGACVNYLS